MTKPIDFRKTILDYVDLPVKEVVVPEWGGIKLYVRAMNASERDAFMFEKWKSRENSENNEKGTISEDVVMNNITASILARVICSDPEGTQRVFSDKDVEALGKKSAKALDRLNEAVKEINGDLLSEDELEKNLQGQSEDSGLDTVES